MDAATPAFASPRYWVPDMHELHPSRVKMFATPTEDGIDRSQSGRSDPMAGELQVCGTALGSGLPFAILK